MRSKSRDAIPEKTIEAHGPRWSYTRRGYALAHSLRQLKRHKLASLGTLMVLGITLSLPFILYFAGATLNSLSQRSLQGESITVYLNMAINDLDGAALATRWQSQPSIERTEYLSREQALAMLSEDTDITDAIEVLGSNPLPGAVVLYPQQADLDSGNIESLAQTFRKLPEVDRVQLDLRWVRRLEAVVTLIKWIGGLLAAFLTLTALLVIANTIRLELSRRRAEMEVASLLGASSHFINRPILYTGALYGLLGGILACIIALVALNMIQTPADSLSSLYQSSFTLKMPELSKIMLVLGVSVVLGLIGAISSLNRSARQLTHN
ncbi:MAG: permease-like cell division protein FtsX [Granulosicoccus sp.]